MDRDTQDENRSKTPEILRILNDKDIPEDMDHLLEKDAELQLLYAKTFDSIRNTCNVEEDRDIIKLHDKLVSNVDLSDSDDESFEDFDIDDLDPEEDPLELTGSEMADCVGFADVGSNEEISSRTWSDIANHSYEFFTLDQVSIIGDADSGHEEEELVNWDTDESSNLEDRHEFFRDRSNLGKRIVYYRFGMPYFKDKRRFGCPMNADEKQIVRSTHKMFFDVKSKPKWNEKRVAELKNACIRYWAHLSSKPIKLDDEKCTFERLYHMNRGKEIDWMQLHATFYKGNFGMEECIRAWNMLFSPSISNAEWSKKETERLMTLARKYGFQNWVKVAELLNTNRTCFQCFSQYIYIKKKTAPPIEWTKEEDDKLQRLVAKWSVNENILWNNIVTEFVDRSYPQLFARWKYALNPELKKGKFTDKEEQFIRNCVKEGLNYRDIAKQLGNRSIIQVRSYCDYISKRDNPLTNIGLWTEEEEDRFEQLIAKHGSNDWVLISNLLGTRTRTQCRHKYRNLVRVKRKSEENESESNKIKVVSGRKNYSRLSRNKVIKLENDEE